MLVTGIYILAYIIVRAVCRYRKQGNIWKREDPFWKLEREFKDAEIKWQIVESLLSRYLLL